MLDWLKMIHPSSVENHSFCFPSGLERWTVCQKRSVRKGEGNQHHPRSKGSLVEEEVKPRVPDCNRVLERRSRKPEMRQARSRTNHGQQPEVAVTTLQPVTDWDARPGLDPQMLNKSHWSLDLDPHMKAGAIGHV